MRGQVARRQCVAVCVSCFKHPHAPHGAGLFAFFASPPVLLCVGVWVGGACCALAFVHHILQTCTCVLGALHCTVLPAHRYRAQKLKYAMSDARKESLRLAFGQEDGEYGDSVMGLTRGMLGAESGSGRIRGTQKKKQKRQGVCVGVACTCDCAWLWLRVWVLRVHMGVWGVSYAVCRFVCRV